MAPSVAKIKSAFLFYQTEKLGQIKTELNCSMGQAMTELSARWKALPDTEKQLYFDLEAQDRERFRQESMVADAQAAAEQEAKRLNLVAQSGEDTSTRGARRELDEERRRKEEERQRRKAELEAETDPEILEERRRIKAEKKAQALERQKQRDIEEKKLQDRHKKLDNEQSKQAAKRLEYLLAQSSIFGQLKKGSGGAHDGEQEEKKAGEEVYHPHHRDGQPSKKKKKGRGETPVPGDEDDDLDGREEPVYVTRQPNCIKYGQLKPYQIESLNWMIHLADKGLNGILADEMGLGKTVQSIAILGYQYEYMKIQGPHLVCVPKSTLSNWLNEFSRWCPCLRVIKFHGSREEREEMVRTQFTNQAAAHDGKRPAKQILNEETGEMEDDNSDNPRQWDVCVTTYEVCNTEKGALSKFAWKYLVIDEAHRLKNDASMFSTTVRTFQTAHRLLLTGTPLQNNLHELWALLNFLLPDIFSSSEQFDEWFNLDIDDAEAKQEMISQLHKVLRPFMLRRLKADVAKGLPPKTETLIMVGMSKMQKQLYKKLLLRDIESITSGGNGGNRTSILNIVMQLRKCCGHPYLFEGVEDRTLDPLGEHLVENCGKLVMVDKLLKRLKERGSRVLIFTQMTRVLDILEDYMVMRGYKYCRIDGNTEYDVRESSIDAFNAPNSDKFCFILSTRAGGLGINLQTADTCILYDSDWNPQADLQAQDRCHRLGQKKPVSVYRLVSENTIEEKIVERAQQKLKLDAMIVQQGRLQAKDKVTKEEILAAVRFGADTVFRSEESTITDDDIDVILERGMAKTKELTEKIKKADKGDLLDFRMDGGISAQTFEGVDYSDLELRNQLRLLAADSIGKRERRAPTVEYNPVVEPKKSMVVNNLKVKLPKSLRLPRMEDHQFYNRERLLELSEIEFQTFANLKLTNELPPQEVYETAQSVLPEDLAQEKRELLAEGFEDWTKSMYFTFVKECAKYGRDDLETIASVMDRPVENVVAYSRAFWSYGETELKKEEWERAVTMIEKGEKRLQKQKKEKELLKKFVSTFKNPRTDINFTNRGNVYFAIEQDRALLSAVDKYGYGNWDKVREVILNDDELLFQHQTQAMSLDAIDKRVGYRMRQMEREVQAREVSKGKEKPPAVIAAEKAIEEIKEMDEWESKVYAAELDGKDPPSLEVLSQDARIVMDERSKERQVCLERFREIEIQLRGCRELAEKTYEAVMRGDQYVNYSHITLKSGGQHVFGDDGKYTDLDGVDMEGYVNKFVLAVPKCGHCKFCTDKSGRKLCFKRREVREEKLKEFDKKMREWVDSGAKRTKQLEKDKKEGAGKYFPRKRGNDAVTSSKPLSSSKSAVPKKRLPPPGNPLGNKKMSVPDDILPEFCRLISANGTRKRMDCINAFVKNNPSVSIRQVTFKFAEMTTRDKPGCIANPEKPKGKGRAFIFYLRPRFYHLLPESERPKNWENYVEEDEAKWQLEQENELRMESDEGGTKEINDSNSQMDIESHENDTSMDFEPSRSQDEEDEEELGLEEEDDEEFDNDETEDEAEPFEKKSRYE